MRNCVSSEYVIRHQFSSLFPAHPPTISCLRSQCKHPEPRARMLLLTFPLLVQLVLERTPLSSFLFILWKFTKSGKVTSFNRTDSLLLTLARVLFRGILPEDTCWLFTSPFFRFAMYLIASDVLGCRFMIRSWAYCP